ncbi:MAG: hypothetical protein IPM74_05920 [Crocinitomicaceae bacterium]|nr:hypothetical protein [Crocinitomicaceae bacterium]MBK8925440.1 hypothetical protein [Crocinitomicaceae bacterium]
MKSSIYRLKKMIKIENLLGVQYEILLMREESDVYQNFNSVHSNGIILVRKKSLNVLKFQINKSVEG